MGNYRNFELVTYFVAGGACRTTKEKLEQGLDFFQRYMRLDKVYLEPFRDGQFASEAQIRMIKETFEARGIKVSGGITTAMPTPDGDKPKQRIFNTFCYNDPKMLAQLAEVSEFNGRMFDEWIIDDFYFTNCTCKACREGRDRYNAAHGITDGSWQGYRQQLMIDVSRDYMIAPCKRVNPDCRIIIKYPNWMESYQETGYTPLGQKDLFDGIYTGTETRDPVHTDQHLPRYLSFSLMRYMEAMAPGRNGGGWFDPFDCRLLEYYLEQAYLTAFSKPKELMMFCFQALEDSVNIAALGFMLDKLDALMDHMGDVVGVPCYIPNASQGEDNVQDFLGMHGFPIVTTPWFPQEAKTMLLTSSSACDPDIVKKLEPWVANGGHAIVTSGFIKATLGRGIECMTSLRDRGRKITTRTYATERLGSGQGLYGWAYPAGSEDVTFPVLEFRNNATWGALCKAVRDEESYTLLARDTYGDGEMTLLTVPEAFSDIKRIPAPVLSRMRREFAVNGAYLEGEPMISLFHYDNDSFVLYQYADRDTIDTEVQLHVDGATSLTDVISGREIKPLYTDGTEAVFPLRTRVGQLAGYHINRAKEGIGHEAGISVRTLPGEDDA